jgi:hypothetical protein
LNIVRSNVGTTGKNLQRVVAKYLMMIVEDELGAPDRAVRRPADHRTERDPRPRPAHRLSYLAGPSTGLADLDAVLALGGLERYPYAHAARAQMLDRLGRDREAAVEWGRTAACGRSEAARRYFAARV